MNFVKKIEIILKEYWVSYLRWTMTGCKDHEGGFILKEKCEFTLDL